MEKLFSIVIIFSICITHIFAYADGGKVSLIFVQFYPEKLSPSVSFEVYFVLRNTGSKAITPSAEVTVSGEVLDQKENIVYRIIDKRYFIYNFWPGDSSGKQRIYIGALKKGMFKLRLHVNAYNRAKSSNVSTETFDIDLNVE